MTMEVGVEHADGGQKTPEVTLPPFHSWSAFTFRIAVKFSSHIKRRRLPGVWQGARHLLVEWWVWCHCLQRGQRLSARAASWQPARERSSAPRTATRANMALLPIRPWPGMNVFSLSVSQPVWGLTLMTLNKLYLFVCCQSLSPLWRAACQMLSVLLAPFQGCLRFLMMRRLTERWY